MATAEVQNISLDKNTKERIINVSIYAKGSVYVQEPKDFGFPMLMNSAPLVEGINHVLEFGHEAVNAMKGNKEFMELAEQNRTLRREIHNSDLAARVRQLLLLLDAEQLTPEQAKSVLLVHHELKSIKGA